MIGPGTGVAPFRAFLLDRKATGAPGKNWLFFGHSAVIAISSIGRVERHEDVRSADANVAGVVRDGDKKILCPGPHARSRPRVVTLAAEAPTSISAATPTDARTANARWSISSPSSGRARPTRLSALSRTQKEGRFQQDVY